MTNNSGLIRSKNRKFRNESEFINLVIEYIRICENEWKQYPNIAGFCVFMNIHRDTFYQQKEYYSDTYKKVQEILENSAINSKNASDTMKIFYLKNKFKYQNVIVSEVAQEKPAASMNYDALTNDELKQFLGLAKKCVPKQ